MNSELSKSLVMYRVKQSLHNGLILLFFFFFSLGFVGLNIG
uniref:Uncharacterized protein n=1 Tax=Rhizophora mucronata TaxID=61149 RepID=A0A2P2J3X4_RHIMU